MAKQKPVVFLEGCRLYLRPLEQSDLELCRRWVNDPEPRVFLGIQFPTDEFGERQWFEKMSRSNPRSDIVFIVALRGNNRPIGTMGLHRIDWINRHAATGALIGEKEFRGRGFGQEAKELLLEYAFNTLGLHRINSYALRTNARSLAYLKKSGYKVEGRHRKKIFRGGRWVDEIALGILESEWRRAKKKR